MKDRRSVEPPSAFQLKELWLRVFDAIVAGWIWCMLVFGWRSSTTLDHSPASPEMYLVLLAGGTVLQALAFRMGLSARLLLGEGRLFAPPPAPSGRRIAATSLNISPPAKKANHRSLSVLITIPVLMLVGPFALYLGAAVIFFALPAAILCCLIPALWLSLPVIAFAGVYNSCKGRLFYDYDPATGRLQMVYALGGLEHTQLLSERLQFLSVTNYGSGRCGVVIVSEGEAQPTSLPPHLTCDKEGASRLARHAAAVLDVACYIPKEGCYSPGLSMPTDGERSPALRPATLSPLPGGA